MEKVICIFTAQYLPVMGGVQRYTYNLAKTLVAMGHRVIVVTCNTSNLTTKEEKDGILVYRLPSYAFMENRNPILKMNQEYRQCMRELKNTKIDYVVLQTRFYQLAYIGAIFARKNKLPSLVIDHSSGHIPMPHPILFFIGKIYDHSLTWLIKKNCKNFYGVSQQCVEWLKHFKIRAKGILYNAVDKTEVDAIPTVVKIDYRKQYNLPSDSFIACFAGRLIPEKGILQLIEAIEQGDKMGIPIYLFIAGEGPLEKIVENKQSNKIHYLGNLPFPEAISLYKQSDLFFLPTLYPEGFPTSLLEAALCGCYCVTTPNSGHKELILTDEYGYVLEKVSSKEILKSIQKGQDEDIRLKGIALTKQLVQDKYTWNNTASYLLEQFSILSSNQ